MQKSIVLKHIFTIVVLSLVGTLFTHAQEEKKDSIQALPEVTVQTRRTVPVTTAANTSVNTAALRAALGSSISELLSGITGISTLSSGATTSIPVLHGMYGSRLPIMQNGTRIAGQLWGVEHEPEVDIESSHSITVVKGADALRYASDALGGAILVEQRPLPYSAISHYMGRVALGYSTNGHAYTMVTEHEGHFKGLPQLAWRIEANYENAGDRTTAKYLLNNTGSRAFHSAASIGWHKGPLRIEGRISRFDHSAGIMLGTALGSEDIFRERLALGRPINVTPFTRHIGYPKERVIHYIGQLTAAYATKQYGTFSWQSVLQHNNRREWAYRRSNRSSIPEMYLKLTHQTHRFDWEWSRNACHLEAGSGITIAENHSVAGTGVVPLIPNYTDLSFNAYTAYRYTTERLTLTAGLRMEQSQIRADGFDITGQRYGGRHNYLTFSYGVGAAWQLNTNWQLTTHLGSGTRIPNVYERYIRGSNPSAGIYLIGDETMKPEKSLKWISSVGYRSDCFSASIEGYLQHIHGFIYDAPTGETITVISGCYPLFRYKQTNAFFAGMDGDIRWDLTEHFSYHFSASLLYARNTGEKRYLPFMPAPRLSNELSYATHLKHSSLRIALRHSFVAKQRHFEEDADFLSYTPPAYHLLGCSAELAIPIGDVYLRFLLDGTNLLNKEYKEYTNRARYFIHEPGRALRGSLIITF